MSTRFWPGLLVGLVWLLVSLPAGAVPYAALVMDARTGKVLHARNADTKLHPASLTKMMTLYVAFEAIERGELSLDTVVKISRNASREPPSKLGLRSGQKIKLRYLIRAAAVKSANDAATAIAETVAGSEAAFARRMTATAKAMGMRNTTFKNAHGLTQRGHLSTARDMAILGRRLFFDHQDYYNLFSRVSTSAGTRDVYNTNRRFLANYRGADGIKTGYTRAAGYNLVGSARRGNERIIASLFGGKSKGWRTTRMKELLDIGFSRAPSQARVIKPNPLGYIGNQPRIATQAVKSSKLSPVLKRVERPIARPGTTPADLGVGALVARAVLDEEIENAVQNAVRSATRSGLADGGYSVRRPAARADHLRNSAATVIAKAAPIEPTKINVAGSGNKSWSVHLGTYSNRRQAEQLLLVAALQEVTSLDGAYRKIEPATESGRRMYRARFVGLTKKNAERACARLSAKNAICVPLSPGT